MKNPLYISIIGLSLSVINELKKVINEHFSLQYDIHWTHIADKKLQVLLMNDDLIDLSHLKRLDLSKLFILKLYNDAKRAGQLQHDTLYLPLTAAEPLYQWFEQKLSSDKIPELSPPAIAHTAPAPADEAPKSAAVKISYQNIQRAFQQLHSNASFNKIFSIRTADTVIAVFDVHQKTFYRNYQAQVQNAAGFEITAADINQIVSFKQKCMAEDLNQGIWHFIWDHLSHEAPAYPHAYQLLHWPQPKNGHERSQLLKMASYFSHGCTVQFVQEQLNISAKSIQRFVFACEMAQMIEVIPVQHAVRAHTAPSRYSSEQTAIRSFFSKLRLKLGLQGLV